MERLHSHMEPQFRWATRLCGWANLVSGSQLGDQVIESIGVRLVAGQDWDGCEHALICGAVELLSAFAVPRQSWVSAATWSAV
mmetsp:Transcript_96572/g.221355  ORF Transcript_96572/g.221355 Transcript_96572/m.221355 type:complete len:83 (+) Transcript_96572:65-313(+)